MSRKNQGVVPPRLVRETKAAIVLSVGRMSSPERLFLEFGLLVVVKPATEEDDYFTGYRGSKSWRRKQKRLRFANDKPKKEPKKPKRKDRYHRVFSSGY